MPLAPPCLLGPRHIHPGCNTEEDYLRLQRDAITTGRKRYPNLVWSDPWISDAAVVPYVTGGLVQIRCGTTGCGNCPSVSLDWGIALCWDCGAIYKNLSIADVDRATDVLLCRPVMATRNWRISPVGELLPHETVEALIEQNIQAGDPVPTWGTP